MLALGDKKLVLVFFILFLCFFFVYYDRLIVLSLNIRNLTDTYLSFFLSFRLIYCRDSRFLLRRRSIRLQRKQHLNAKPEEEIKQVRVKQQEQLEDSQDIEHIDFADVKIEKVEDTSVADNEEELVLLNEDVDKEEVNGDYSCQKCHETFATWNEFKVHMRTIHEPIQCFKCKICWKVYNNMDAFNLHVTTDHPLDQTPVHQLLETITLYRVNRGVSLSTHYKRRYNARNFLRESEGVELLSCSQCNYKTNKKTALAVHVAKHLSNQKYPCETCGREFKVRRDLTYHVRFSHRQLTFSCDLCGKVFANNKSLHAHRRFNHFNGKFECRLCSRLLASPENLDIHMHRQHVEKKPTKKVKPKSEDAVCEICGKYLTRSDKLKVHMRVHTGERPFVCAICKETFARKNSLVQHLMLHTGAKPYVCDICGKAFAQKPGLTGHRKSHPGKHPPLPPVFIGPILDDMLRRCEQ